MKFKFEDNYVAIYEIEADNLDEAWRIAQGMDTYADVEFLDTQLVEDDGVFIV